jgi:hypothetical protein
LLRPERWSVKVEVEVEGGMGGGRGWGWLGDDAVMML